MAEATNTTTTNQNPPQESDVSVRSWVMVGLTAVFVILYVAALLGWIPPLPDNAVVLRLEPIIGVIIGYYFGRVPGEKNEKTLKEEVNRQANKAKEAEQKKEQAQQEKTRAEQKVRDTRAVLSTDAPLADAAALPGTVLPAGNAAASREAAQQTVAAALRVLDA
ncbi:MAG TPA: hypothetical protein VHG08_27840 [Longimicrobium sp.]|nr:hypothetical protein [Longimicrobium sp.]